MKVQKRDLRMGLVVLVPQVVGDLYHLAQLIEPLDAVRAATVRTPPVDEQVERRGKPEKRPVTLTVRVEGVEFQDFSDRLRIHGTIVTGQDVGMHHTFNVEADGRTPLGITKRAGWRRHHLERVERAVAEAKQPLVWAVAIEEDEATIAEVQAYGVREVSTLTTGGHGKMYKGTSRDGFLDEVIERVASVRDAAAPLLVVGPGWTRERLLERLGKKAPEHAGGVYTEGTGQAGMPGVHEAVRRGMLERVVKDHAVARDVGLVEELFTRIAADSGLAVYGPEEVHRAVQAAAVETLLVVDDAVREGRFDETLALAEEVRTHVHVVAHANEAGQRLTGFGGIAGLLRFRLP